MAKIFMCSNKGIAVYVTETYILKLSFQFFDESLAIAEKAYYESNFVSTSISGA